jgi:hypothetical protein
MSTRTPFTFEKGLKTSISRTQVPDGGLDIAENVTYRPRDNAITPCEGRALVGGGGHGAKWFVPLEWDSILSTVSPNKRELFYSSQNRYRSIPPAASVDDPRVTHALASTFTTTDPLVEEPDVVAFARDQYLFGGQRAQWIRRADGIQEIVPAALAPNQVALYASALTSTDPGWTPGGYYIFFTWYDSVRKVESGIYPGVVRGYGQELQSGVVGRYATASGSFISDGFFYVPTGGVGHILVYVNQAAFDSMALLNPTCDKIRMYITLPDVSAGAPSVVAKWYTGRALLNGANPFLGSRVTLVRREEAIATIQASAPVTVPGTLPIDPHYSLLNIYPWEVTDGAPSFKVSRVTIENSSVASVRTFSRPRANTAASFNGSIVMNDLDNPQRFWWTWPDDPHSIPPTFFGDIQSDATDEIVAIRTVRSRCGIFTRAGVHRLNYLPTSADVNFREGRLAEQISTNGLVSRRAVTRFSVGGKLDSLAWASAQGIYRTESLYECIELTPDLDWAALVGPPNALGQSILVDDPNWQRLWFFYNPAGGIPDRALLLHYAGMTDDVFPLTGPIWRPGGVKSASLVTMEDGTQRVVALDTAGSFYYEGIGYADASVSESALPWRVRTGRKYLAERGVSCQAHQALLSVDSAVPGDVLVNFERGLQSAPAPDKQVAFTFPSPDDVLLIRDLNTPFEHTSLTLVGEAGNFRINSLTIDWDPLARSPRRSV